VTPELPPVRPLPLKERRSILFLEKGRLDVKDGAFVVIDKNGVRKIIAKPHILAREGLPARFTVGAKKTGAEELSLSVVAERKPL